MGSGVWGAGAAFRVLLGAVFSITGVRAQTDSMSQSYLGLTVERTAESVRRQLQLERDAGLTVVTVAEGSPAATAGIETQDILLRFDDQWLFAPEQLMALVRGSALGTKVQFLLVRSGQSTAVEASIGSAPIAASPPVQISIASLAYPRWIEPVERGRIMEAILDRILLERTGGTNDRPADALGLRLGEAATNIVRQLGLDSTPGGVVVSVTADGPADRAGLRANDLITAVAGQPVLGLDMLRDRMLELSADSVAQLAIVRGGNPLTVSLTIPPMPTSGQSLMLLPGEDPPYTSWVDLLREVEDEVDTILLLRKSGVRDVLTTEESASDQTKEFIEESYVIAGENLTIEVEAREGIRSAVVTDRNGSIVYRGRIDDAAERAKIPMRLRRQIEELLEPTDWSPRADLGEGEVEIRQLSRPDVVF